MEPDVVARALQRFSERARQVVRIAAVARVARLDERHALVTVAARMPERSMASYLTVPVARDGRGGLTVYDLPSFSAAPARAAVDPADLKPLNADDAAEIDDVLTRFLRAYLDGEDDELAYFVRAGTRIAALAQPLELVRLDAVSQVGAADGRERTVLATVRARDRRSRVVYRLRYRVRLVRADRWHVASVNTSPKEG